jgi:chemotaxis protein CheX
MSEIVLAEALDMRAAAPLLAEVRAARGADLQLDASKVERLGGQCLQILLAAEQAWAADEHAFQVSNASTAFKDGWVLMGAEALAPLASLEIAQ